MRSRIPLVIVVAALLILGLLVFFGIASRLRQLARNLPTVLENELASRLDRKAEVGSVKLISPSTAVISDLRIASGRTFAEGTLFSASRAVVRFDMFDLLTGRAPVTRSITSVTLKDPSIRLARDRNGVWDIEDLLRRPPVPAAERFRGLIRVHSGKLTVVDHAARLRRLPAVNSLRSISGYINLAPAQSAILDLSGGGNPRRVRRVRAAGRWGIGAPVTHVNLFIEQGNPEYWLDYFADIRPWNIEGGRADARAILSQPRGAGIVARGSAALRDSAITSPYLSIPVRPFSANFRFFGTNISLAGRGLLRGSPVTIRGSVLGFDPGRLKLRITSERVNLAVLQAAIKPLPRFPQVRWAAPGIVDAIVTGTARRPEVAGILRAPRAEVYGTPVTGLTARGRFRGGTIFVTGVEGRAAGGRINLSAAIGLQPIRIKVRGTAGGINLAALPLPLRAAGLADARFALDYFRRVQSARLSAEIVQGRLASLAFARASANVAFAGPRTARAALRLTRGTVRGVAIEAAAADLALRGRRILVRRLAIDTLRGALTGTGTATLDGALNLGLSGTGADLRALLAPLGYKQLTGTADFAGSLTGTITNPRLAGQVIARDGRIRQVEYDLLMGRLVATPKHLVIEDAIMQLEQAEIATAGRIIIARKAPARIEMQVRAREVNLAHLFRLIGAPARARGIARADLEVRGRLPNIRISGEVLVIDAVIAGVPLDLVQARLQPQERRTVLTELIARRADMQLTGQGIIGSQGELQISLAGENLRLSLVNEAVHPYAVLEGPMTFSGEVRGTLRSPTVQANIASTAPVINRQQFESLTARLRWDGTRLIVNDGALTDEAARYELPLTRFNPGARSLDLEAEAASASASKILDMLRSSPILDLPEGKRLGEFLASFPAPTTGLLNASMRLAGRLDNLTGGANLTATGVQLGKNTLDRVELEFITRQSAFLLQKIAASAPGVRLAASAQFVRARPTQLAATVENTELAPLVDMLSNAPVLPLYDFGQSLVAFARGLPQPVAGTLNAALSVGNLQTGPTGRLELTGSGVSAGGAEIGDIAADARLVDGAVVLDRMLISPPQGQALVQGAINPEGLVSLTGQIAELPLSILRPWVGVKDIAGTMDASFAIVGPADSPTVQASISATDVATPRISIESITAEQVTIVGSRLSSTSVIVQANGNEALFSGSLPFAWAAPFVPRDQPILLHAELPNQDFSILEALTLAVEEARGALMATVDVTGTLDEPVFDGEAILRDGFLNLRGLNNDLTALKLAARFEDSSLVINTLSGSSSLGGTFSVSGNLALADSAGGSLTAFMTLSDLRLDVASAPAEELVFTATGQLAATESLRSPLVQGDLVVRDTRIRVPAEAIPTALIPQLPVSPELAITVDLARDVVVERGTLRVEVVGPTAITGTLTRPAIAGTVQIADGQVSYLGRTLKLMPGGTASLLVSPAQPAVVSVDVTAVTRVSAPSPVTGLFTRYTLTLDIAGPIGNLDLSVRSSPPGLSDIEALRLVFRGTALDALVSGRPFEELFREQLEQVLLGLAVPRLFEPFEIEGLVFALEPGFDIPLIFTASTPIAERLTLSYSRSVIAASPYDIFSLSYSLRSELAFTVQFQGLNRTPRQISYLLEYFRRF